MSILVDQDTRIIVQGITGREGRFHTERMLEYKTRVVGGVTPGKGDQKVCGVPVFNNVKEAVSCTGANASVIFVPARFALQAIHEAADSGIGLAVCITEGIPIQDMLQAVEHAAKKGMRLVGPNCPGLVSAGIGKLGIIPASIMSKGPVGVVSRSGTLTYEIVHHLTASGIGQSTCIGIGGDPILGTRFAEVMPLFENDTETEAVIVIGEIGGSDEEEAAAYISGMSKPVIGFISGKTAPEGKRMGHAGAMISGGMGTVQSKETALRAAGVSLAGSAGEVTGLVRDALKKGRKS